MSTGLYEPENATSVEYQLNGKIENYRLPVPPKLADVATASTSATITETVDGAFNAAMESIAEQIRPVPVIGPAIARALNRAVLRIKRGTKAPASRSQDQAQAHTAQLLHTLAVLIDATAFYLSGWSTATYDTFSTLRHEVMPWYVETQLAPVRKQARSALTLAQDLNDRLVAAKAKINTLASSLPWDFHADTFDAAIGVWVGLFDRLWHKVYNNLEPRVGKIEGTDLPQIRGTITKLSTFVHGSLVPEINKIKQQMTELLTKTVPDLKRKQAADEKAIAKINNTDLPQIRAKDAQQDTTLGSYGAQLAALAPLLTAAGFGAAFANAAANDPAADTDICDPATQCVGEHVLSKPGWQWLKPLLSTILSGAIDALLLANLCAICRGAQAIAEGFLPVLSELAVVEGGLASIGCGGSGPDIPPPAYTTD